MPRARRRAIEILSGLLARAMADGLVAATLVTRNGETVGLTGAITEEEATALAALVMQRLKSDELASRLDAGEIVSLALDDREVAVGIFKRAVLVTAVLSASTPAQLELVRELRYALGRMLPGTSEEPAAPPSSGGTSGSGSGPAELPLIEFGITVARNGGKA
jgi:hypothetical protein